MADKISYSRELNIYLSSEDGQATRTLKVNNPRMNTTLAEVRSALEPAFANTASDATGTDCFFFYDEQAQYGYEQPMTTITGAEITIIEKTIRQVV